MSLARQIDLIDIDTYLAREAESLTKSEYVGGVVYAICRSNPPEDVFQDEPVVIVEVLSKSTRRIDEGEKRDSYFSIPSLSLYLLIEQETPVIIAYRRTGAGFVREVYDQISQSIKAEELGVSIPLSEIYDGVEFET